MRGQPFQNGASVRSALPVVASHFGDLIGQTVCMRQVFANLALTAAENVNALIEGETGTGKELVAEAIHRTSPRASEPYVVFDCGALPAKFAEGELRGHEREELGTPTYGVFERAHGGTLFLDHLAELPRTLQPILRSVLEKREVKRIGSTRAVPVDVRVIAASNGNLTEELERGNFPGDIYFQIAVARVVVPPLRERMQDLPLLVDHFLKQSAHPRASEPLPSQVWRALEAYHWPGNVRELMHTVQRLLIMPDHAFDTLTAPDALRAHLQPSAPAYESPAVAAG